MSHRPAESARQVGEEGVSERDAPSGPPPTLLRGRPRGAARTAGTQLGWDVNGAADTPGSSSSRAAGPSYLSFGKLRAARQLG